GPVEGVLADVEIQAAIDAGYISEGSDGTDNNRVQPASLDLTLGRTAHRLRASFLPDQETVDAKLKDLSQTQFDLGENGLLEPKVPYLIELREQVALPPWLRAKANPKSSIGRLDVFTR